MRLRTLLLLALLALSAFATDDTSDSTLCPAGYGGPSCKNPICSKKVTIRKHSTSNPPGDMVSMGFFPECTGNHQFNVDTAMTNDMFVVMKSEQGGYPWAYLTDSTGVKVSPRIADDPTASLFRAIYSDLAPGQYTIQVSSGSNLPCSAVVTSINSLSIDGGFVTNVTDDNAQNGVVPNAHQGIAQGPKQGVPSYLAFKANRIDFPASVDNVTFFSGEYKVTIANPTYPVVARYRCDASSIISRPFTCPEAGVYFAMFQGIDNNGFGWSRVYSFNCDASGAPPTTPSGPTTTPRPATSCDNYGTLVDPGQKNATCYCGKYFYGDRCQYTRCFNNGQIGEDDQCVCQNGFQGKFCTDVVCANRPGKKFNPSSRSLTFVVRASSTMATMKDAIDEAARNLITQFDMTAMDYFGSYALVAFNNHKMLYKNSFDNGRDFLAALNSINYGNDTVCGDSVLQSISAVLSSTDAVNYPLSPIYVFTDAVPDDTELARATLVDQISSFRGPVFFVIPGSTTSGCIDPAMPGYQTFRSVAQYSQGIVTRINTENFGQTMIALAELSISQNIILSNDFMDSCHDAPAFQSIFKDESSEAFWVYGTGNQFNATVVAPSRKTLHPEEVNVFGDFYVAKFRTSKRGNYLVKINTDGSACQYRISERRSYDVFFGASAGPLDDFRGFQPYYNFPSGLVVHMNGIRFTDQSSVFTEATVWTNDAYDSDKRVVLYASNGIYRDGCDFNLYYGTWSCEHRDMPFYMTVFIDDRRGFTVERTITGMCKANVPTPTPGAGNCLNGGVVDKELTGRNGTCLCAPGFQGSRCETIQCQNNGTPRSAGYCDCAVGFTGRFCEVERCHEYNNEDDFSPNYKTLSLFIHDTLFTRGAIQAMLAQTPRMLQGLYHRHPEWIVHFQLIRFNENDREVLADSDSPTAFAKAMADLYDRNTNVTELSCANLNILQNLNDVLNSTGVRPGGMVFVFVNGLMRNDLQHLDNVMDLTQRMAVSLNFVQMSGNPCGKPLTDTGVSTMMSLATATGGEYIQAMGMDAGDVLSSIPYLYQSSLIYENYYDDCASAPRSFYFPVDGHTQAFTVNIIGDLKDEIKFGHPEKNTRYNPVDVYNSVGMASRMMAVTRPCDEGWSLLKDDLCVMTVPENRTWNEAREVCRRANSILPIEFSKDDDSTLSIFTSKDYWIGLSDEEKVGVWKWDSRDRRDPLYLNNTGYAGWAPGQNLNDPNKRCAYKKHKSGWVVDDCATKRRFMCMKSAYDYNYIPGDEGRKPLPRGHWKIALQTYEGPCMVKVRAQSSIRLFMKYSSDLHKDFGSPVMNPEAKNNHIIAHITGLDAPSQSTAIAAGALEFAQMYTSNNMTMIGAVPFYPRADCAYAYVSRNFTCPSGALQVIASGVDSWGYDYQRIRPALCYGGNSDHTCDNNGIFEKKSGRCVCTPNFNGERCEIPICQNGWLEGVRCKCHAGYMGHWCQTPMCHKRTDVPGYDSSVDKSMVIIMDGTNYGLQSDVITNFSKLMQQLYNAATNTNKIWFHNFIGIVVRDTKANVAVSKVLNNTDFNKFVKAMQDEMTVNAYKTNQLGVRDILSAVKNVADLPSLAVRSQAFIITSGLVGDYNYINFTLDAVARTHTQINTVVMGDKGLPGNVKYSDPGAKALLDLTYNSGGQFYQVPDYQGLQNLLTTNIRTLFDNFYVTTRYEKNCSSVTQYLQVSSQSTMLTFDLFASSPKITIRDPSGKVYNTTSIVQTNTNFLAVVNSNGLPPGLWSVSIDNHVVDPGACLINVRGVSKNNSLYVAYTDDFGLGDNGLHSDVSMLSPRPDDFNAIVVKSSFGTPTFAQIYSGNGNTLYFSTPLIKRLNCDYGYIGRDLFVCPPEMMMRVAIDGTDANGHPYQRVFTAHCL